MFFTVHDIMLLSKRMKQTQRVISEDLRGWNWNEPPIYSPSTTLLNVSDLTNGLCETNRYAYLRHTGVKYQVKEGVADLHYVYVESIETIKRLIYENGSSLDGSRLRTLMGDEYYKVAEKVYDP